MSSLNLCISFISGAKIDKLFENQRVQGRDLNAESEKNDGEVGVYG
ncbi:hypothetical protein HMPREF1981_02934 [Bacteroides pyogenes F0041]|uniref:Uncharacterized protein n=1 Tax=Bacteroides pyogenes F0041 TaxID=1321819 RepID=U2CCL5_9BACE|nr:hypothetical protein HMPREF1981_02934 [Bacteroides pyogenes F0041]